MKLLLLFAALVFTSAVQAQTMSSWNGIPVGSSPGQISKMNGKTIGTAAGNYSKWNNLAAPSGGGSGFTLVQAVSDDSSTLTVAPIAAGDLGVVCYGYVGTAGQTIVIADSAGNTYTARPTATAVHAGNTFQTGCFDDLNVATGGATTVSETTPPTGSYGVMWFFEFHRTSGTWAFDNGVATSNATGSGATITGPSIALSGAPGVGVTGYLVNDAIVTNPASGNAWNAAHPISPDGNAANAIIASSAGTQQSAVTDQISSDTYCASAVAYK